MLPHPRVRLRPPSEHLNTPPWPTCLPALNRLPASALPMTSDLRLAASTSVPRTSRWSRHDSSTSHRSSQCPGSDRQWAATHMARGRVAEDSVGQLISICAGARPTWRQ